MGLAVLAAGDVLAGYSAHQQGVGDQGTMAAPGHSFGAHDGQAILLRTADQLLQGGLELSGLHVIGKASERGVSPTGVDGISGGVAQTSQAGQVFIGYPRPAELSGQGLAVELRVVRRTRDGANIQDAGHIVSLQERN